MQIETSLNRLDYIDIAKGFGILLVVLGHLGILQSYIYMFHMPMFFFISGFLFKKKTHDREFIFNKTIQLLIPYFVFLLIIYSIQEYDHFRNVPLSFNQFTLSVLRFLLGGQWLSSYTTVFWFITTLFFSQIVLNYLIGVLNTRKVIVVMVAFLILAYLNAAYFPALRFPWDINVVLLATPICYSGFLFKETKFSYLTVAFSIFCSFLGILLVKLKIDNFFDMKNVIYGIPGVTFLISIGCTLFILLVGKFCSKFSIISRSFIAIGKSSIVIMYLHQTIQILLHKYLTDNLTIIFISTILLSYCFYLLFRRFIFTRILFLGSKKDFDKQMINYKFNLNRL